MSRSAPAVVLAAVAVLAASVSQPQEPASPAPKAAHDPSHPKVVPADQALRALRDGNARYVRGEAGCLARDAGRRGEIAAGQHPRAAILGCSDSRVPPELVFDQGLGDLFVIREAGNTADELTQGSLEYAVEHLGVRLIVVLGHERCGAVQAALGEGTLRGHVGLLVGRIRELIPKAGPALDLDTLVRTNVAHAVDVLRHSEPLLAHTGDLKVVGARYDLDTGEVELLP
jgi:carbonic anhydrase